MSFVRKTLLTLSGRFLVPGFAATAADGDGDTDDTLPQPPQPSSVVCVLYYYPPLAPSPQINTPPTPAPSPSAAPSPLTATVTLTLGTDGQTWSGQWDSSVAEGRVDWFVYSSGSVVAAAQGNFVVKANNANLSVR
jgi:hypothetical protein